MGSLHSTHEGNVAPRSMDGSQTSEIRDGQPGLEVDEAQGKIDESRLVDLMRALQRIARLQREATSASVNARQKKREASFKRQAVWVSDGKFMGEIQRLTAQGNLEGFEELKRLAAGCQSTRDGLGPVEQEGIEAEQQWEGHIWKLRQAEEQLSSDFEDEFGMADAYSAPSTSATSSQYEEESEPGVQIKHNEVQIESAVTVFQTRSAASSSSSSSNLPFGTEIVANQEVASSELFGLVGSEHFALPSDTAYSDSGIGDIDESIGHWVRGDLIELPPPIQGGLHSSVELYPQLLTDFKSRRDRINKWLEYTVLHSPIEGTSLFTTLRDRLESENHLVPSNWSQLVMAYWELDGAAIPDDSKLASVQGPQKNEIPPRSVDVSAKASAEGSRLTPVPINLRSRRSSNIDHGYFSDNTSKSREGFLPLRPPPPPPHKPNAKSSEGEDDNREQKQPP